MEESMEAQKTYSNYSVVHAEIQAVTSKTKWSVKRVIKTGPVLDLMIAAVVIVVSYNGFSASENSKISKQNDPAVITASAMAFKADWQKLWADQAFLTRNLIFCIIDGLPGTDHTINRLLQHQVVIGNAIKPFYGEQTGNKLSELLEVHVSLATGIIKATASGNTLALDKLKKVWHANAEQVSSLLCSNNPGLLPARFEPVMKNYLLLTAEQAMMRKQQMYEADMLVYDKLTTEAIKIADLVTEAFNRQFPEKFK
jgi:hypothetical protein